MSRMRAVLKQRHNNGQARRQGLKLSWRATSLVMQWATNSHTNKNVVFVGHLREPIVVRTHYSGARNGNGPEDFLAYVPFQTSKFGRVAARFGLRSFSEPHME
jgi:hypothetical protein